jgi:hypothetical protein
LDKAILAAPLPSMASRVAVIGSSSNPGTQGSYLFIFNLSAGDPTIPERTIPAPASLTTFGTAIALKGSRILVGSEPQGTGFNNVGIAHLFDLNSANPNTPVHTFQNPTPASQDFFGTSVNIDGNRIVIGAYGDKSQSSDGSVYVYDLAATNPTVPFLTIRNPLPGTGDRFGFSTSLSGDRLAIGAYLDTTGGTQAGIAYLYDISGASPAPLLATFNNPTPAADDRFGISVALSGTRLLIGAEKDDTIAADSGMSYLYDLAGGNPAQPKATLATGSLVPFGGFGWRVAVSGTRIAVSDTRNRIRIFDLGSSTPTAPVLTVSAVSSGILGALALSDRFLVAGDSSVQRAYVYDLNGATPATPFATLINRSLRPVTISVNPLQSQARGSLSERPGTIQP